MLKILDFTFTAHNKFASARFYRLSVSRAAMPTKLVVEYAKSGRGACKHCGAVVPKGNLRVGSVNKGSGGHLVTHW